MVGRSSGRFGFLWGSFYSTESPFLNSSISSGVRKSDHLTGIIFSANRPSRTAMIHPSLTRHRIDPYTLSLDHPSSFFRPDRTHPILASCKLPHRVCSRCLLFPGRWWPPVLCLPALVAVFRSPRNGPSRLDSSSSILASFFSHCRWSAANICAVGGSSATYSGKFQ